LPFRHTSRRNLQKHTFIFCRCVRDAMDWARGVVSCWSCANLEAACGHGSPWWPRNLSNRAEVDTLHAQWAAAEARIAGPPEAKPYNKLYEFFAQDIDGNYFRVFYDFAWEEKW